MKRSPLAPSAPPSSLPPVAGVRLATGAAGIKYQDRADLLLVDLVPRTQASGVLTQSTTASAPVDWCRQQFRHGRARGLVVNAGNANAFTGRAGHDAVEATAQAAAEALGCRPNEVFLASTGVIGEPLPWKKITPMLARMKGALSDGGWLEAARAIGTTDTFPKLGSRTTRIQDTEITLTGIAKGSGMIAPNMATMLAFLFTDAALPAPVLQMLVQDATDRSFNAITVDGDTSTSDTVLLFATGAGPEHAAITHADDPLLDQFRESLSDLMVDLAQQIVRDGEGATKFITVTVTGAESRRSARRIAFSIANSPLVKTAMAGEDANWGRIVMAVGKSGEPAYRDRLQITIGGIPLTENGARRADYEEQSIAHYMKGQEITIGVDVGVANGQATVWTCDLTHDYISINADYRT